MGKIMAKTDVIIETIQRMVRSQNLSFEEAAKVAANKLSEEESGIMLGSLMGKPLLKHDSILATFLAQRLGINLEWRHIELNSDAGWQKGRGGKYAK